MSEVLWKRDPLQLPSAKILLKKFGGDIYIFEVNKVEGAKQLCWGIKMIGSHLKGKVIEIGIDAPCAYIFVEICQPKQLMNHATDDTNSKNLELYSVMGEHDNVGFSLSYFLLSTTSAVKPR